MGTQFGNCIDDGHEVDGIIWARGGRGDWDIGGLIEMSMRFDQLEEQLTRNMLVMMKGEDL